MKSCLYCGIIFLFCDIFPINSVLGAEEKLLGMSFSFESPKKRVEYSKDGTALILENEEITVRVYGKIRKSFRVKFTMIPMCNMSLYTTQPYKGKAEGKSDDEFYSTGVFDMKVPKKVDLKVLYFCLETDGEFVFQGDAPWLKIQVVEASIPTWALVVFVPTCLFLSFVLTALNLGLMSLNKTELKILMKVGTESEKEYAKKIFPVREYGNYLLSAIIISGVTVNNTLTIFMEELTSGLISIIFSTLMIVIFGELIPQAVGCRFGLLIGSKLNYFTRICLIITFPISYPFGKLLDKILGEEIGSVYNGERLKELLIVTKDYHGLGNDEVGIISGALDLKTKTVKDIMTAIDSVYMIPVDSVLDFDTLKEIEYNGFSRIPVYDRERSNIVSLVHVKQLTLLDADDKIPLKTIIEYYHNEMFYVMEYTPLDQIFKTFREGRRGHMAFIQKVNHIEQNGDSFYQIVGIVTLEDVLEEILQTEILDETDVDAKINHTKVMKEPSYFKERGKPQVEISSPLALAAARFLAISVDAFKEEKVSIQIINRMIKGSVAFFKAPKNHLHDHGADKDKSLFIYEMGVPSEYFTMVLEGRVKVEVGKEKMVYEAGPMTCFGSEFLIAESRRTSSGVMGDAGGNQIAQKKISHFFPDYTVSVLVDTYCVRLKYSGYKAVLLANLIERDHKEDTNWEDEIERALEQDVDSAQN